MVDAVSQTFSNATSGTMQPTIAQNFGTFLQLLTTQLRNQNPLEPLDTNQFTQQLTQFASVEQQMSMNSSLQTLVSLQKATQDSTAVGFLGSTVRVDGSTVKYDGKEALWTFNAERGGTATITITNSAGETVYTENRTVTAGDQEFKWTGKTSAGAPAPTGDYKISVVAQDASGRPVAVSTQVEGIVDGVDLTATPPILFIGDQSFTVDKVRQVRRNPSAATPVTATADQIANKFSSLLSSF